MLPYLLAVAGGYLIGSANKNREVFADGGMMAKGGMGKGKYKIIQDVSDMDDPSGAWLVIDTEKDKILGEFDFKKEAQSFVFEKLLRDDLKSKDDYADGGMIELYYVQDANGNVKNISKSYEDADRFWEKSLKFNGDIRVAIVPKEDWEKERVTSSNIKRYAEGGMMAKGGIDGGMMAKGGMTQKEKLTKELLKLQRELNSSRLRTYIEGDTSEEQMARFREREVKIKRFNEILEILKESEKMADGGMMAKGGMTIGSEIVGTKKMYFIYNNETGKKSRYYKSKEDAQKELRSI
jgi:hypothetical protein